MLLVKCPYMIPWWLGRFHYWLVENLPILSNTGARADLPSKLMFYPIHKLNLKISKNIWEVEVGSILIFSGKGLKDG